MIIYTNIKKKQSKKNVDRLKNFKIFRIFKILLLRLQYKYLNDNDFE